MIIETSSLGNIEITVEQIYRFENGIPGFEEENEFALLPVEGSPFFHLQSLKEKHLSFLLADPFVFFPEYEFELGDSDSEELELQTGVQVRCIVTLRDDIEKSTMNILAPLVLNPVKRKGRQIVLHNSAYATKHPLFASEAAGQSPSDSIEGGA
ncbi:flagellar assembly protein FliW [Saccharibacillus sp. CPCC 101409]|uniref:flagellar assembly protein FliW n=1 Tax=Saccharibacillus sp. CPCC 101409 TaxID=3058041 RepID=UPI002672A965|nr:flagellar assembly protein FliW [Saccharibacillus sp. CPCC 101409]MDO3412081.1 flagellar assembly protein FliW [Saccharibacillus sp. CPCC 101409]